MALYRDSDGVTRKMQRIGPTAAAAENLLREALRDRLTPSSESIDRDTRLSLLMTAWLDDLGRRERATATVQRYADAARAHVTPIGEMRIREATTPRLDRMVLRVAESAGPAQARIVKVVLSGMFDLAVRFGAVTSNPATPVRVPVAPRAEVRAATPEEMRQMVAALREYDRRPLARGNATRDLGDFGELLAATGARPGELLALRWDDFDMVAGTLRIVATVVRIAGEGIRRQDAPKSDASRRTLVLPAFAVNRLGDRYLLKRESEWIFPSAYGTLRWPENVRVQWKQALAGTPVAWMTPKSPRKAVATIIERAHGAEAAKEQLGNGSVEITKRHYVARPAVRPDMGAVLAAFGENGD